MTTRTYIKLAIIISGLSFAIILVILYFLVVFLSQNLNASRFQTFLIFFGIPMFLLSLGAGIFISITYFFRYRNFLKTYQEEYKSLVSKIYSDQDTRKTSFIENLFKGIHKDDTGIYHILPFEDEFGDIGKTINIILTNVYEQDTEKSRLLSYQKEVINRLLDFANKPILILRKMHHKKSTIIVSNINLPFLKAIKAENVVRLASRLIERLKVSHYSEKYLYDLVFDIVRAESMEDIKEIFVGQEIGIEEFLVDIDWFFQPIDRRSSDIISVIKDLIKGSDLTETDKSATLEILNYKEYRKNYELPDVVSEAEGFIGPVVPDDEDTFIKKKNEEFYREGLKIKDFKFYIARDTTKTSSRDVEFSSDITIFPATSKHFSPEKMLIICFDRISF